MKDQHHRSKPETFLVSIVVILAILVGTGCTWTFHRPPMELKLPSDSITTDNYQYYVIDESAKEPDAFFITKKEADSYKEYFKEHHNYKVVSVSKKNN